MTETTTTPISTIVELYCRRIDESGPQAALAFKREGEYHWLTWNDLAEETCRAVAALVTLGVQPGDRVAHVAENRYEWVVADLAIQMAGAIHVPIHSPLTGVQIAWQVRHSGAKVVLLSGPGQAEKFAALGEDCPRELTWVSYDPVAGELGGRPVHLWSERLTSAPLEPGIATACHTRQSITPESLATIIYTSGTTGEPKGVMLTQHNLATNALETCAACQWEGDELRLNFLPLSHIFARTCDLYCWIAGGTRLALAESRETILADCRAIHPTLINGVPHFYDRLYRGLCEKGLADAPGALQGMLGGAIRHCCGGGAALPEHLYDFFHARGVPLLQGYGLTETSPVMTISTEAAHRRGSSGRPLPSVEIRIAEDGEILTRGPHVMVGYYQNQAATDEILKNGWLATGDLGRIDEDGFLYITGRKKEIIVTLGGKNVAPVMLESLLTQDPLLVQALVVGDDRPYLAALLVANPEVLAAEMRARKIEVDAPEKILTHPGVLKLVEERVRRQLASVSHYEQVQRFALLPRGFSIEHGELTAKLSLRRKVIQTHFAAEIDSLYRRE